MLESGCDVDDALVSELLGVGYAGRLKPLLKTESTPFGTAQDTKHDGEEDEEGGGGMDMAMMAATLVSMMDTSGSGGAGAGGGADVLVRPWGREASVAGEGACGLPMHTSISRCACA